MTTATVKYTGKDFLGEKIVEVLGGKFDGMKLWIFQQIPFEVDGENYCQLSLSTLTDVVKEGIIREVNPAELKDDAR